jgi:hypothetical protein
MSDEYVERMVRRRVGLDALRRLRRLVDAERAQEAAMPAWAAPAGHLLAVLAG